MSTNPSATPRDAVASAPCAPCVTLIEPLRAPLRGEAHVPGDKSISHRAVLFSAMAEGTSHVSGVLDSEDVRSSLGAIRALGAKADIDKQLDGSLAGTITGWGAAGPAQPDAPIDCGNSGTTVRLLMGVLAPWDITVELTGDESLCRRPMRRITAPLMKMGAHFEPAGKETLPITERGSRSLRALTYDAPMASAQLKTAILLAGRGHHDGDRARPLAQSHRADAARVRGAHHGRHARGLGLRSGCHGGKRCGGAWRPVVGGVSGMRGAAQARQRHPHREREPQPGAHRVRAHA